MLKNKILCGCEKRRKNMREKIKNQYREKRKKDKYQKSFFEKRKFLNFSQKDEFFFQKGVFSFYENPDELFFLSFLESESPKFSLKDKKENFFEFFYLGFFTILIKQKRGDKDSSFFIFSKNNFLLFS